MGGVLAQGESNNPRQARYLPALTRGNVPLFSALNMVMLAMAQAALNRKMSIPPGSVLSPKRRTRVPSTLHHRLAVCKLEVTLTQAVCAFLTLFKPHGQQLRPVSE